jgi:hypothetical protein
LSPNQLLAFPVAFLYARHPVEVPDSRVGLIFQHPFDAIVVPRGLSAARWDAVGFEVPNDRDEPIGAAREHSKIDRTTAACSSLMASVAGAVEVFFT